MKIVLVTGNLEKQGFAPLGPLYLAAYLRKVLNDIDIKVFDYLPSAADLLREQADVIGFSSMTLTYGNIVKIAKELRPNFQGVLIAGGIHISLERKLPECFDLGIVGEGEKSLSEIILSLQKNKRLLYDQVKDIPGLLLWKDGNFISTGESVKIQDLDQIPFPARDLLDMDSYLRPNNLFGNYIGRGLTMISSRGCSYQCEYCSTSKFWKKPRYHSPEYIVNEIESLISNYQINLLYFSDDNFSSNIKRLRKLANLMALKGMTLDIGIMGRIDFYNSEIAELYKTMGIKSISVGIESGSERMIRILKGETFSKSKIAANINSMVNHGFEVSGCFMIGSPTETESEILETMEFAAALPLSKINFYISTPFYGTKWWDIAVEQGIVPKNPSSDYWSVFNLRDFDLSRPVFSDTVSPQRLKELTEIFREVQKRVFYFDWRTMKQ